MAKALLGGVARIDPRMVAEMRRLQQRVSDLESELLRLELENSRLHAAITGDDLGKDLLTLQTQQKEPALA